MRKAIVPMTDVDREILRRWEDSDKTEADIEAIAEWHGLKPRTIGVMLWEYGRDDVPDKYAHHVKKAEPKPEDDPRRLLWYELFMRCKFAGLTYAEIMNEMQAAGYEVSRTSLHYAWQRYSKTHPGAQEIVKRKREQRLSKAKRYRW